MALPPSDLREHEGRWRVSADAGDRASSAIATVAALVMGFPRVYTAAHYPWDVLAGLSVGAFVTLVGWLPCG